MSNPQPSMNSICYIEIPAPNPEQAAKFYSTVFGWTAIHSNLTDLNYWTFETVAGGLSGGFDGGKPVNENGITLYIKVSDIDETLSQVQKAGGSIMFPKEDIGGGYGFSGTFKDNQGNRIGLYSDK